MFRCPSLFTVYSCMIVYVLNFLETMSLSKEKKKKKRKEEDALLSGGSGRT